MKQQLSVKLKNTPMDTPQVHCSVSPVLNKEETLSVLGKLLADNNLEVDRHQQRGVRNLRVSDIVFVLNMRGKPLMPTKHKKAKYLLSVGKAIVVKRKPFTIQLTYATGETKQDIVLGVDPGYKYVGFSAVTEKKEMISGTLELENGMTKRLDGKKTYRKLRRKNLWHRKSRFNNRANARVEGKIPPSVQRRLDTHSNLINILMKLLPITKINIEVANFNIQKINNPEIIGKEYQHGNLYDYKNLQSYVIAREHGKCQLCGKEYKDKWNLHHIIPRSKGGTDKSDNIAILHEDCHQKLHKEGLVLNKSKQYKAETNMNIIKWRLVNQLREILPVSITFGYLTSVKRNEFNLKKTHFNDAFVIANGNIQERVKPITIVQKKRNNRAIQMNRKGFKPSIRKQRYEIQPKDSVWIKGKEWIVKGMFSYGKHVLVTDNKNKKSFNIKLVEKVFHTGNLVYC